MSIPTCIKGLSQQTDKNTNLKDNQTNLNPKGAEPTDPKAHLLVCPSRPYKNRGPRANPS